MMDESTRHKIEDMLTIYRGLKGRAAKEAKRLKKIDPTRCCAWKLANHIYGEMVKDIESILAGKEIS